MMSTLVGIGRWQAPLPADAFKMLRFMGTDEVTNPNDAHSVLDSMILHRHKRAFLLLVDAQFVEKLISC